MLSRLPLGSRTTVHSSMMAPASCEADIQAVALDVGASSVFSDSFFVSFFELSKRSHARTHLVFDLFTPIDCRRGRRGFIFTEDESGSNYRMLQGRIQAELPSCKIELLERLLKSR